MKSKGKVTNEIRDGVRGGLRGAGRAAPDNRSMIVIMADVARGGLNQAVIEIEEARGRLAAADRRAPAADRAATLAADAPRFMTSGAVAGGAFVHPEDPARMHVRISTDQPWDVAADVLAIPYRR